MMFYGFLIHNKKQRDYFVNRYHFTSRLAFLIVLIIWIYLFNFMYMNICLHIWMYVCYPHECLVPAEVIRGHQVIWNWSYKWLWVLGTNPGYGATTKRILNHRPISPRPHLKLFNMLSETSLSTKFIKMLSPLNTSYQINSVLFHMDFQFSSWLSSHSLKTKQNTYIALPTHTKK